MEAAECFFRALTMAADCEKEGEYSHPKVLEKILWLSNGVLSACTTIDGTILFLSEEQRFHWEETVSSCRNLKQL